MTWVDLGYPVLLAILIFWGLLLISGVLTTFTRKENQRDMKAFFHRLMDTGDRNHA